MYSGNQSRMCRHFFRHFLRHYLTLNWTIFRKGLERLNITILVRYLSSFPKERRDTKTTTPFMSTFGEIAASDAAAKPEEAAAAPAAGGEEEKTPEVSAAKEGMREAQKKTPRKVYIPKDQKKERRCYGRCSADCPTGESYIQLCAKIVLLPHLSCWFPPP